MNTIDYLRISLIDRCNFRCSYCMPEDGELAYLPAQNCLTNEELLTLLQEVFIPIGFSKFRLTGGEPLLRKDIVELVQQITLLAGVQDLSLTTNGYRLADLAQPLYAAGLRRINISLDSLDVETFRKITGRNHWHQVWQGILAAHRVGFDPLKLNVVIIPGVNEKEVVSLAALTIDQHWHVRFIEFMPIGNRNFFEREGWIPSALLRQEIADRFGLTAAACHGNGPADVFQIPGALGTLGFISQMSECFCERCNRLRLSADGWLRPCLLNESGQISLRDRLRSGESVASLRAAVGQLLMEKADIHFKERDRGTSSSYERSMSQIGG